MRIGRLNCRWIQAIAVKPRHRCGVPAHRLEGRPETGLGEVAHLSERRLGSRLPVHLGWSWGPFPPWRTACPAISWPWTQQKEGEGGWARAIRPPCSTDAPADAML